MVLRLRRCSRLHHPFLARMKPEVIRKSEECIHPGRLENRQLGVVVESVAEHYLGLVVIRASNDLISLSDGQIWRNVHHMEVNGFRVTPLQRGDRVTLTLV